MSSWVESCCWKYELLKSVKKQIFIPLNLNVIIPYGTFCTRSPFQQVIAFHFVCGHISFWSNHASCGIFTIHHDLKASPDAVTNGRSSLFTVWMWPSFELEKTYSTKASRCRHSAETGFSHSWRKWHEIFAQQSYSEPIADYWYGSKAEAILFCRCIHSLKKGK